MGIDAGIKPGELYTPRCRLAEVRRVASEQRSEAHTKGEVSTARTCSLRCRLDPLHGSDADADCPCRPLDAHAVPWSSLRTFRSVSRTVAAQSSVRARGRGLMT